MIICDTNVISELMRPTPYERVVSYLNGFTRNSSFICSISIQELWFGVIRLDDGDKRSFLKEKLEQIVRVNFAGRVLNFDDGAAKISAELLLLQKHRGHQAKYWDTQIAAIAIANNFTLLTRNTKDFNFPELRANSPWTD